MSSTTDKSEQKWVFVINDVGKGVEEDHFKVDTYDVTYDNRGVLQIGHLTDPNTEAVLFGPDTWKYVMCYEEEIT
jgi:hypothetical protein